MGVHLRPGNRPQAAGQAPQAAWTVALGRDGGTASVVEEGVRVIEDEAPGATGFS